MEYSLTNPQNSIWLTEKFYSGTSINNISGYNYIDEPVNFNILSKAINEVVKLNDAMRIKVKEENNSCIQYISEYVPFTIETIELTKEEEIRSTALQLAKIPFNIENNLLFKFTFFKLPNKNGGFFLSAHHIIGDSWSLGLVVKQIMLCYSDIKNNAYTAKEYPSYTHYIKDEKDYLESDKFKKDKEYWNDIFKTVPEVATIPSFQKQNNASCNGDRLDFSIDSKLVEDINNFCKDKKVSLYNFFMSLYSLYLGRVSGLDDFVIGTPVLNRTNFEQKNTMGMFISTAPLRIELNHSLSFTDFVKDVSARTISLFRHQKYPYQYILEDLRTKDSSIPNLYNVVLSYQITKTFDEESKIKYTAEWLSNGCCADDLQIHLLDLNDDGKIHILYDYKTDKYSKQDIADLHSRILTMLNQVMSKNDVCLKDIEIVTPEEKHKILYDFNNTKVDYPKDKTIVDLFEEQVKKTPDNIAVVFEDQKLTYKELNEKANQLAHYMHLQNIQHGDIVGIYLNKSLEVIVSMFAILKLGASFLPLDLDYPKERLNYILGNSEPKLILSSRNINKKINFKAIYVDLDNPNIYNNSFIDNLNLKISTEDIMYVMYTSGSTGKPKGVMVKHKNIIRLAMYPNFINFSKQEVMVQTGTIVFDACIFEIFGSLLHGFKLYIMPKDKLLDIEYFSKFLKEKQVTILFLTTGLFNQLGLQKPEMFKDLKYLLTGGDVISKISAKKIISFSNNLNVINCYGPTENGSYSTCYMLNGKEDIIPTGKPITNSTCYIVNQYGSLCPIGVPGELWVGGDGVAKGYLNNPELTKEKFIDSPFKEEIIYKTGDLVKWLPDGNIEFIGRIDNQVKVRGFRIELFEIDNNILTYSNIKQSISVIHTTNNSKLICSYIIADQKINIKNLKEFLSKTLPNYMVPTSIMQLDKLPLNINGKIDKKLLPMPSNTNKTKNIIPARNNIDKELLNIIMNLFNLKNISIDDNLFDFGIDSLSSITLSSAISSNLKISLTVKDIFNNPTVETLSNYISTLTGKRNSNTINKMEKMQFYPLSSGQKRIFYSSNLDNTSTLYNVSGGIIVDDVLDVNKLQKCFNILINRHESLRTHFEAKNDDIVQIVEKQINFELESEDSNTSDLNSIFTDFIKPFDLSIAPLFRAKIVNLNNNKTLMLIDMHHIISDGTSLNILIKELCDLYNDNKLPNKEIDYTDFTLWEKEQFETDDFQKAKEYWINQFKNEIPLLNMPTNYPRPSLQSFDGCNYHAKLSEKTFHSIHNVAKELNITPYMLMLSVFYILLSKYTSQDNIVIGTPIVGRELPDFYNILGMFVNTLALRNEINHALTFEEFTKNIKESCLNSFKNQIYPFDMLVKDLNIKRDASRNPLFDVMFVYQNNGYPKLNLKNTNAKFFVPNTNISKFDLTLEIIPINNEYSLRFEYSTKLFNEDFIKNFSLHYINILNTILENTKIKIANINMMSEEEKNQILYKFNNTNINYPENKTIVDLFEKQVEETPNNTAVVFEDKKLTYKELNEKANQLARYLLKENISSNSIIGIMLPRSLEMIIAILGILKSGACYIPIDPSFPKERIEFMLRNSNAAILLKTANIKNINYANAVDIDLANPSIYTLEKSNINKYINPNSLAYIIYTSGSTGKPKGVCLKHKSLYNLACYLNNNVEYFKDIYANLAIASITTVSFDIFLFETLISLQRGLNIILANEKEQTNPSLLDSLISKYNIIAIQMTPSRMEIFINNKEYMPHLSNLKYITLAGEALSSNLKNKILELGNITIYNGYGPSETTVFSSFTNVTNQDDITIGKPLSNTYMYILDKDMNLCPIDVPGELYISGDGVGNGYLNNQELTQKSFVRDIFNPNYLMYKTGDLVKYLPNNEIHYIGRTDNQVKVRGLRIELGEIEKWISQYKGISKVLLSSNEDNNGRQYIIAYLTVNNRISINNLKSFLSKYIPRYMIPTYFIILDNFPYLPNGKINKKALPLPNSNSLITKKYIAPINKLEIQIAQIFENLLAISPISTDDNFFDIGGDSLLAMSLQLELLKLNINITYSDIFMFPTVKELSNYITSNSKKNIAKININEISTFDQLLNKTTNLPLKLNYNNPGNILLSGVTGFLGAHILDSFLNKESGNVYCIIRLEPGMTIEQKLLNKLHYYFGTKYDCLIGNRIIPVQADISLSNLGLNDIELNNLAKKIDTVINSAAKVSHYGDYSDYKKINVDGTQTLIDFCTKYNKRFYHISTLSVSGNALVDNSFIKQDFNETVNFSENNFYINQSLDNVYVRSKFEAEKHVFNAMLSGLDAYILRIGNLMNRFSDSLFQPNVEENAYVNRLLSFAQIKCIPDYIENGYLEFTPVDKCADAIISLVQYPTKDNRVFHLLNHNTVQILDFIKIFNSQFGEIKVLSNDSFLKKIDDILKLDTGKKMLFGIINDFDENRHLVYNTKINLNSKFTIEYLSLIGFKWPVLTQKYLNEFLNYFLK